MPRTRHEFWKTKLLGNKKRDVINRRKLRKLGWDVLVVWECQTRRPEWLTERIAAFLSKTG